MFSSFSRKDDYGFSDMSDLIRLLNASECLKIIYLVLLAQAREVSFHEVSFQSYVTGHRMCVGGSLCEISQLLNLNANIR